MGEPSYLVRMGHFLELIEPLEKLLHPEQSTWCNLGQINQIGQTCSVISPAVVNCRS